MDHGQLLGNLSNHEMTDKSQNMLYMTNTVHACPIQYLEWRLCEMTGATFDAKSPERPHFRGIKAAFLAAVRMVRVHVLNMLPWYHLNTFEVRLVMHLKHCVFHMYAGCVKRPAAPCRESRADPSYCPSAARGWRLSTAHRRQGLERGEGGSLQDTRRCLHGGVEH